MIYGLDSKAFAKFLSNPVQPEPEDEKIELPIVCCQIIRDYVQEMLNYEKREKHETYLQTIRDRLNAIGVDTSNTTERQLLNNVEPTSIGAGLGGKSILESLEDERIRALSYLHRANW